MEEDLIGYFKTQMCLPHQDIRSYSPLALAYVGDAVYDLLIRTEVVAEGNTQVNKYHRQVSSIVKAEAQAELMHWMLGALTEEEKDVYRRGRNANSHTKAKNATMGNYHRATGFEALIGYLYLTEQYARITVLLQIGRRRKAEAGTECVSPEDTTVED